MPKETMSEREQYCYDKGKSEGVDSCMGTLLALNNKLETLHIQPELYEEIKKLREALTLISHICFTSRSGHYTRPETEREDILLLAEEALKDIT